MKWPIITQTWQGSIRKTKVEYITRTTEIAIDAEKCMVCRQCVKVCPKNALAMPSNTPGQKLSKTDRIPFFPDAHKCVFCGTCMPLCPYKAITMKLNNQLLTNDSLMLSKGHILPEMNAVKVGKVELKEPNFKTDYWIRLLERIEPKRAAQPNKV